MQQQATCVGIVDVIQSGSSVQMGYTTHQRKMPVLAVFVLPDTATHLIVMTSLVVCYRVLMNPSTQLFTDRSTIEQVDMTFAFVQHSRFTIQLIMYYGYYEHDMLAEGEASVLHRGQYRLCNLSTAVQQRQTAPEGK